jgi:hypothetical protein
MIEQATVPLPYADRNTDPPVLIHLCTNLEYLAAIVFAASPAAILLAGDSEESVRGVGDAHPEGDRVVDETPRRAGLGARA